jgi:hypothetical protein
MMTLLGLVIVAEGFATLGLLIALFTATTVRTTRRRRRSAIESRWHDALRSDADGPAKPSDGLSRLSPRRRVTTIAALVGSLSGDMVARVTGPTDLPEVRRCGDAWTRSRWWWRRLHGVRMLIQLNEPPSAYRSMLTDRRPEVRAEAASWVAQDPDPTDISQLISMLDTDVKTCRFAAENALRRIGAAAIPALTSYLNGPAKSAAAALAIASTAATPALLPTATRWSRDPDPLNRTATAALLAAVGADQAGQVLVQMLEDPAPRVRAAAASGLGQIALWAAAPQLLQHLHDPDWAVRRSAAAALRLLGPVGRLCLRRALDDLDPRTVEIARHVLDLPESALGLKAG